MKKLLVLAVCLISRSLFAQSDEFGTAANELIYSEATMGQLKRIVDSLHLKYKVCDLTSTYFSFPHARASFVRMNDISNSGVKNDIDKGIPLAAFLEKYPGAKVDNDLLVVKNKFKDYENKDRLVFQEVSFEEYSGASLHFDKNLDHYDGPVAGKWVYAYYKSSDTGKHVLSAFYFWEEFVRKPLPSAYGKMILYTDCMVDTSAQVFYDDAFREKPVPFYLRQEEKKENALTGFFDYVYLKTGGPVFTEKYSEENDSSFWVKLDAYQKAREEWEPYRLPRIDQLNKTDPEFRRRLNAALQEALKKNEGGYEFEEYAGRYISRAAELELKRKRMVTGMCSQDDSPRYHAFEITKLAAETARWDVFLRAHLDIMNDNFNRTAETNMAKARRGTYIKELEVLDIDVLNLLLGSALRIDNPGKNHYFGDVGRMGKSLAETKYPALFEAKISEMIADTALDDYNRVMMYFLWSNYIYYLPEVHRREKNRANLDQAIRRLPPYLYQRIKAAEEKARIAMN